MSRLRDLEFRLILLENKVRWEKAESEGDIAAAIWNRMAEEEYGTDVFNVHDVMDAFKKLVKEGKVTVGDVLRYFRIEDNK